MAREINPAVEDMIRALKSCAVETPQEKHPCEDCYLYPFSRDGRMSTGRTCFEHLALDVADALNRLATTEAELAGYREAEAAMQREDQNERPQV